MKIALVYDFLKELGGLERVMFFQANKLQTKYTPELFFSYVDNKKTKEIVKELELERKIKINQILSGKIEIFLLLKSLLLKNSLKKVKADILISHSFLSSFLAFNKKLREETPFIVMLHHPPNFLYSTPKGWANNLPRKMAKIIGILFNDFLKKRDKKAIKNANAIIVNSKYTGKRVEKIYNRKDYVVIYPNVSNFFRRLSEKDILEYKKSMQIKKPLLFVHGRLIPDKKIEYALKIIEKIPDCELIISGNSEKKYLEKLKLIVKNKNLGRRVKILGKISSEELLNLYNTAATFIMCTPKEDFGITSIEAMACGCPVVAWGDEAGPSEIITDGVNGFLAKPYNFRDIVEKIEKSLIKNWNKKKIVTSINDFKEKEIEKKLLKTVEKVEDYQQSKIK